MNQLQARPGLPIADREIVAPGPFSVLKVDGELLSHAVLERDEGPLLIGAGGLMQTETGRGERLTIRQADGRYCELLVPTDLGDDEVVVLNAPLVCQ